MSLEGLVNFSMYSLALDDPFIDLYILDFYYYTLLSPKENYSYKVLSFS